MKKLSFLGLPVIALFALTACEADSDPKIDTSTDFEFVLNTPQLATQFIDLSTQGNVQFTVSQPNYGVTVVPTYGVEISLNPDFTPVTDEPVVDEEGETHVVPGVYKLNLDSQLAGILVAKMSDIASGINELNGIYDEDSYVEDYVGPLYVRATAHLGSGTAAESTATVSNIIVLSQVQGYPAFESKDFTLSVPGDANGWSQAPKITFVQKNEDKSLLCKGFAAIAGSFKVTDGDWDGSGNWGAPEDGGLTKTADGTYTATLIQNSQTNFNTAGDIAEPGLYYFELKLSDKNNGNDNAEVGTMTLTPIASICITGDFGGWNWDTAVQMTNDGNYSVWTASGNFTAAGWKFAMNNDWAINLGLTQKEIDGKAQEILFFDGANIFEDATTVTLNLEEYPWSYTVQ